MAKADYINRIICAANKTQSGIVILGIHHCDGLMNFYRKNLGISDEDWAQSEQGFMDKNKVFRTREQAWVIAAKAKQIFRLCGRQTPQDLAKENVRLYSENIY